jgi:hypothetical protein
MLWTNEIREIFSSLQNKVSSSGVRLQQRRNAVSNDLLRCAIDSGCSHHTRALIEHSNDIHSFILASSRWGKPVSTQGLFYEVGMALFVTSYASAKNEGLCDETLVSEAYKIAVSYQLRNECDASRRARLLESALESLLPFARVRTRASFMKDYFRRFEVADGVHEVDVTVPLASGELQTHAPDNIIRVRVNETLSGIGFFRPGFHYWNETLQKRIQSAHRDARNTMEAADWSGPIRLRGDVVWLA